MEASKPKTKSSTDNLFAGLIIFVGLVLGYLLYSSYPDGLFGAVAATLAPKLDDLGQRVEKLDLRFTVLDRIASSQLEIFGEIPVTPGTTGKEDLFSPF